MIRITDDVMDIARRIKEIDYRYELYYNRRMGRFEVYIGDTQVSVIPYDSLDARTVIYLQRTRRERCAELMKEMERENEENEKKKYSELMKNAENRLEEILR